MIVPGEFFSTFVSTYGKHTVYTDVRHFGWWSL